MDSNVSHIPSPSIAWSRIASTHVDEPPSGATCSDAPSADVRRDEEAAQLRARLLRLIETSERNRKAVAAEAQNAR